MKQVKQFVAFLEGKKTYIVAVLSAADGLYQYYIQHGSNWHTLVAYLLVGGGLASLRAAVSKVKGA